VTYLERMGHRDIETTQRYADYAPHTRDAELIAAAFRRDDDPVGADCRKGVASMHEH
jgi:hypothetical protein